MKNKIILTKNFKKTTDAKYCAAILGANPGTAIELDDITLENVREMNADSSLETKGFENFGCGILLIGEGELPTEQPATTSRTETQGGATAGPGRAIEWNGLGFTFADDSSEFFYKCERLEATKDGLRVMA